MYFPHEFMTLTDKAFRVIEVQTRYYIDGSELILDAICEDKPLHISLLWSNKTLSGSIQIMYNNEAHSVILSDYKAYMDAYKNTFEELLRRKQYRLFMREAEVHKKQREMADTLQKEQVESADAFIKQVSDKL